MANRFRRDPDGIRLVFAVILSVVLIILDANSSWLATPRNLFSVTLRPVQYLAAVPQTIANSFAAALESEPDVKVAYENLREEYFQLKAETLLLESIAKENAELRNLLGASDRLDETLLLASIMSASIDRDSHSFVVGQGLRDGIRHGQAVIDDQGVIGQITDVMPLSSVVTLITDPGHALPVLIERNGIRAVVQGKGSLAELNVPFMNLNADVIAGDVLVSSGLGGRFPAGYPVAKITSVKVIEDEAFIEVTAEPLAALNKSTSVLVLSREGASN